MSGEGHNVAEAPRLSSRGGGGGSSHLPQQHQQQQQPSEQLAVQPWITHSFQKWLEPLKVAGSTWGAPGTDSSTGSWWVCGAQGRGNTEVKALPTNGIRREAGSSTGLWWVCSSGG